ncbi:hypothetical protein ACFUN8_18280 [Streptomyces sp. NPDC057307]|uniref:effector-associated constant component EACC1 n=1 Tax=Streptomyces sp. NPDC057307 TaxID=3346096 RepID=UPI003625A58E
MELRFETTGPDREGDLRSLYNWLADDRALRGHVRIEAVTGAEAGRMGPSLDAVLASISAGAALGQLPYSYLAWRQGRRTRTPVTINIIGADAAETEAVLRRFGLEPPAGGAAPHPDDSDPEPDPGPDADPDLRRTPGSAS